jgi:hypothetical protein
MFETEISLPGIEAEYCWFQNWALVTTGIDAVGQN